MNRPKTPIAISFIRNFSIIAHIDHGKSTLADRLLELTKVTNSRTKKNQILDTLDIERERGITIKSNSATFSYKAEFDSQTYIYNLIDTPGHVDFSYEVSRALAACEGVLLLVDATQGVEAQTLANLYMAVEYNLRIIPIINKIDLPAADINKTLKLIENTLGLDPDEAISVSAKTGENIKAILESIAKLIPAPKGKRTSPLRALVYDSYYDSYAGAVLKVRIFEGTISKMDRVLLMSSKRKYQVTELGITALKNKQREALYAGEVGYLIAGIKTIRDARVGDTVTLANDPAKEPLVGYQEKKPMVFSGLFPVSGEDYENLAEAIEKLKLNDAALIFEKESSAALGFGFRVGYLGLLHMEIVLERLYREFQLYLINTAPSVKYRISDSKGLVREIDNPTDWPDSTQISRMEEPYVRATIISPDTYLGNIMALARNKRGIQENLIYLEGARVQLVYSLPLSELIFEFHDRLKSCSKGYASLDYEMSEYRPSDLVKVDILVNNEPVDALAIILHKSTAEKRGREIIENLKDIIPRHQFQIPIQATIGNKIIARENISALRKNVTAKCYGGDISRKKKLLEKQKEGKKRLKTVGSVELPQEAFLAILKTKNI